MLQLVGWHAWEQSPNVATISAADVRGGRSAAIEQLRAGVLTPISRQLSNEDKRFLAAMAIDDGTSRMKQLAERLDRSPSFVNNYRLRMLAVGAVHQIARGQLDFAVPGLRSLMRQSSEYRRLRADLRAH
jgi:hypothetical protein